jgi:zinc transporter ZupT
MTDAADDPSATTSTDGGTVDEQRELIEGRSGIPTWLGALLPILLLGLLVGGLFVFGLPVPGSVDSGQPLPDVTVTHAELPNDETVVLHVTNSGSEPVEISQVLVDEAYWNFEVKDGGNDPTTLQPLESSTIVIPYHWTEGWDLETAIVLDDGTTIEHTIVAPQGSPSMTADVLLYLAGIGLLVGIIPVALGMLWFPFMRELDDRWIHAMLVFATGILTFLAFDAGFEAFEIADQVPGAYEGSLLVIVGILSALLLVQAISAAGSRGEHLSGLALAYMVAIGIGLHNLAEGLAIGSSFALGRVSLGAFLIVGFMIHNVTEGPAIVAPVARGERPALTHFVAIGLIAGAPIILGGWIGGFAYTPTLGALFLAIGVGAILQVNWEIGSMVRREGTLGRATNLLAFLIGVVVMYATDLLVAL